MPRQPGVSPLIRPPLPLIGPQFTALVGRRSFRAMNTDVLVMSRDIAVAHMLAAAEEVFHAIELRFSRFLPDSELCRLNARSGETIPVSPEMLDLLRRAMDLRIRTGGIFEPAILPDLEAAGYDRSFEHVAREAERVLYTSPARAGSIADLKLDRQRSLVTMPAGLRIDFGGIGKGYAVDRAAEALVPARDFLVDAGGDIYASGHGPGGSAGWRIGVADPFDGVRDLDVVSLQNQAIATSTTAKRRWRRGSRWLNHIIDPRTDLPVETNVVAVSVIAGTAIEADVYAKVALILGVDEGCAFLKRQQVSGFFVLADHKTVRTAAWPGEGRS